MTKVWDDGYMTTTNARTCDAPDCLRQLGDRNRTGYCVPHQARLRRTGTLGDAPIRAYRSDATSKTCGACGLDKPLTEFYRRSRSSDGYRSQCKTCTNEATTAWREANPERTKANLRFAEVRRKYGLDREQFDALLTAQDGRCACCGHLLPDVPCIDHDHACCPGDYTCGSCVRAALCRNCNLMLGMAHDDPAVLRAGADYLERAQTPAVGGSPTDGGPDRLEASCT